MSHSVSGEVCKREILETPKHQNLFFFMAAQEARWHVTFACFHSDDSDRCYRCRKGDPRQSCTLKVLTLQQTACLPVSSGGGGALVVGDTGKHRVQGRSSHS